MFVDQKIFDKVVIGLNSQDWEQCSYDGKCKYKVKKLKCAAGHLIPDNDYKKEFETGNVASEYFHTKYKQTQVRFIFRLQALHDNNKKNMKDVFKSFAAENNLTWPL